MGHKIILMSTDSIQAKADREGDFLFLEFKYFQTQNDGSVKVRLDNDWCFSRLPTSGISFQSEWWWNNIDIF